MTDKRIADQCQPHSGYLKAITACQDDDAQTWVICPFAGGSSSAFRGWSALTDIHAYLAIYPGRDHKMHDSLVTQLHELVHPLVQAILNNPNLVDKSYILCGHSMGAQIAYEAALLLQQYGKSPKTLVLSACHAPHLGGRRLLSHLSDQAFLTELVNIGGCSPELAQNDQLLNIFLPMLRADFKATEQYRRQLSSSVPAVMVPTILVNGTDDDEATESEVDAWRQWIRHEQVKNLTLAGQHFYITETPHYFIQQISQVASQMSNVNNLNTLCLSSKLEQWSNQYGDAIALIESQQQLSYQQLKQRVDQLSVGLQTMGLRTGDHAILQLPNSIDFVVTCFALFKLGVIPVLTMPTQGERDMIELSKIAKPSAYFIGSDTPSLSYSERAEKLQEEIPSLRFTVIVDDGNIGKQPARFAGVYYMSELLSHESVTIDSHSNTLALLLISGGTTGTPKLIPRTHQDYYFNITESAKVCQLNQSSVYLAVLPAAHNFTLGCPGILGTLSAGGKVVFNEFADPSETLPLIEEHRVTHTALIPTLAQLWEQARDWDKSDLSSLRCVQVGGAKLGVALADKLMARIGPIQQVFGMAEGLLCYTRLGDSADTIRNTQGYPLSEQDEIRIVDEHQQAVAPGEVGELLTRGPYTIRGYYRAEHHNKLAFTEDGFYRTGDLVRQTAAGYLQVVGRIKEQINRNGEKLSVVEIESLLQAMPDIQDAIVLGIPDTVLGERSCAVVIAKKQAALTPEKLRQYLVDCGLPHYKVPDQFEFIQQWPLTAVGKINKKQLTMAYS